MWVNPDVEHGSILGYLLATFSVDQLATWEVAELTEAEALAFAQAIDPNAYVMEDGVIGTTTEIDV